MQPVASAFDFIFRIEGIDDVIEQQILTNKIINYIHERRFQEEEKQKKKIKITKGKKSDTMG